METTYSKQNIFRVVIMVLIATAIGGVFAIFMSFSKGPQSTADAPSSSQKSEASEFLVAESLTEQTSTTSGVMEEDSPVDSGDIQPGETTADSKMSTNSTIGKARTRVKTNTAQTSSVSKQQTEAASSTTKTVNKVTPSKVANKETEEIEKVAIETPVADTPLSPRYFETAAPGTKLPSGLDCAQMVKPTPENVSENIVFNTTKGKQVVGKTYLSLNSYIDGAGHEARIDGNYIGTTDEILQWGACKWGFDEELVRAIAYGESSWYAGGLGDCGEGPATYTRTRDCASFGILQIKGAQLENPTHPGLYPVGLDSTAMNVDYSLAVLRLCYDGKEKWLADVADDPAHPYAAGDIWGCVGRWKSGDWYDAGEWGSVWYIGYVKNNLAEKSWKTEHVGAGSRPLTWHPND